MKFTDVELPSNRKFGFFFTIVLTVIGVYLMDKKVVAPSCVSFGLAALFLLVTLVNADLLLFLNKLWMRLGLLLGLIITPVILGVIFFGLFTPISVLMKLVKRDELRLKLIPRNSHWKKRSINTTQISTFKHQF